MFEIIRSNTSIDFVSKRFVFMAVSIVAILASIVLFFTKGLNYGIDFTGGAEVHVEVPAGWNTAELRKTLTDGGLQDVNIRGITQTDGNEYLVRVPAEEGELNNVSAKIEGILGRKIQPGQFELKRVDVVGPAAGQALRKQGFLAMFYALIAILIYVAVRFDSRYAPGAVIALFHDALVTIGIFVLMGKQFDLTVLAAILALIGYSINDTIVIYDRVRETVQMHPEWTIEKSVNESLNSTLSRTILTSLTTFFTVGALYFFGGDILNGFAFALMVGILVGTYSTMFIASPLVITLTHYQANREKKLKTGGGRKRREYTVRPEPKFQ